MLAARMHDYKQPLVLEDIKVPDILPDQVLVRVGGAGMCRSDVQLIDGYFAAALKTKFPITPGHEIAGLVTAIGDSVPKSAQDINENLEMLRAGDIIGRAVIVFDV
jgi:alcohol dehydrogenase, propanol-preferring